MPVERPRLKYTLEEVFGMTAVPQKEVETPRTVDFGDVSSPDWTSSMKKFSLGLQNSQATILSNLVAEKVNKGFGISDFLAYLDTSQGKLFQFMLSVLERMIDVLAGFAKDKK